MEDIKRMSLWNLGLAHIDPKRVAFKSQSQLKLYKVGYSLMAHILGANGILLSWDQVYREIATRPTFC